MKKGQAITTDLFLAIVVFLVVMITLVGLYVSYNNRLDEEINFKSITIKAFEVSESLLKHSGSPTNWNTKNVEVIGLAESDNIISTEKISNFANLSYNQSKRLLGIGSYEYFIQIRDLTNRNLMQTGSPPQEDEICNGTYQSVNLKRFALWENQKVIVHITVWDDKCPRTSSAGFIKIYQPQEYISYPETAFEEDNNPTWNTQLQNQGDYLYASSEDEKIVTPDYTQINFPNLNIPASTLISDVLFKFIHREDLDGGNFPVGESFRKVVRCWNGVWNDIEEYTISEGDWVSHSIDISSCINTVALANNIKIQVTYDPATDIQATQDIDYAEVIINTI